MVPKGGNDPPTPTLSRLCSTTELLGYKLAGPERFELPTPGFEDQHSSTELRTENFQQADTRLAHFPYLSRIRCGIGNDLVESLGIEPSSYALQAYAGMTTLAHSPFTILFLKFFLQKFYLH
jgi:hypothetical protein